MSIPPVTSPKAIIDLLTSSSFGSFELVLFVDNYVMINMDFITINY